MNTHFRHKSFERVSSEIRNERIRWTTADFLMLAVCLVVGFLMVTRTAGLLFEKDDLRFLWWAHERTAEPWKAFVDPPLFSNYYRPIISIVWWLHLRLFGPDPFAHQMALGLWWLSIPVLLFLWGKRHGCAVMGFFCCLVFLSIKPGHNTLLWKSWLTAICAIVFHLSTLLALRSHIQRPSKIGLVRVVIFYLAASFSKESALFCLPFTTCALILTAEDVPWKRRRSLLLVIVLLTGTLFLTTATLKGMVLNRIKVLSHFDDLFIHASFFSQTLWTSWFLKTTGLIIVTAHLCMAGKKSIWRFAVSLVACVSAFYGARYYAVPNDQALSLAFLIFLHALWLSPEWKKLAVPLVWLMTSFWPLPVLRTPAIAYAADACAAFSLLLGTATFYAVKQAMQRCCHGYSFRRASHVVVTLVIPILLFPFAISASFADLSPWEAFGEAAFHNRTRILFDQVVDDLMPFLIWGDLYFDLGERTSLETNLAVLLIYKPLFRVHISPPPSADCYRLEAYTGANYHLRPEDDPFNLWLPDGIGPPPKQSLSDPYFIPERWRIEILSTCDSMDGWSPAKEFTRGYFPLGQGSGYVNHSLKPSVPHMDLIYRSGRIPAFLDGREDFVLTFWLQTPRWDLPETISVYFSVRDRCYQWINVEPKIVNTFYDWRRVVLSGSEAQSVEKLDSPVGNLELRLAVDVRKVAEGLGSYLSIDEIRVAAPKGSP
ncbi:MAG: hypothetical protein ABIH23_00335 [bacterium]